MNILIIGFGKMGFAHFSAIQNVKKNLNIYIYDKKKIKTFFNDQRVQIINEIPINKKFLLVIIATDIKSKFEIIRSFFNNNNSVDYLLLEKYLFKNLIEFKKFEENFLKRVKKNCYVNCWGEIFLDYIKLKEKKNISKINVIINKSSYLTSFIHFLQILNRFSKIVNNEKYDLHIVQILKSKRKGFKEIDAKFNLKKNNLFFSYEAKKINYGFKIDFINATNKISVVLNNNFKLKITKKNEEKIIDFPLTSKTTKEFLESIILNKKIKLPKYAEIANLNKFIIRILANKLSSSNFT